MSQTQLNNIALYVNGEQVPYEAETLSWVTGKGEYKVRNVVVGGGVTEQVFAEDIKSKIGQVKFGLPTTVANLTRVRTWKNNKNANTITLTGRADGENVALTFTNGSVVNDPEHKVATEGTIDLEWMTNPMVG